MDSSITDVSQIRSLVDHLNQVIDGSTVLEGPKRYEALKVARRLTDTLELPQTAVKQHSFDHATMACAKIALDLGIFDVLVEDVEKPKSATYLAERCGAETLLVVRIMRVMTAIGFAGEEGEASYTCTAKSHAMSKPLAKTSWEHQFAANVPISNMAPKYFKSHNYRNPTTAGQTPFQFARDTKASYFGWMQQNPEIISNFNAFMEVNRSDRVNWLDWFPIQQEAIDQAKNDKEAVFMIDIGGGRGQDLLAFKERFPNAPGRYILQDLQHAVDSSNAKDIEKMAHDFFTPQPIKGARIYFMHYIIHDWDDDRSIEILKNIASAMTSGYSKLYLNDWILPDVGCSLYEATVDAVMMISLAGMERSKAQWTELLKRAGLKLVKLWDSPGFGEGIVEASV